MLKWLKKSLSGDSVHRDRVADTATPQSTARLPAGFLPVQTSDALVADERRQQSLHIIQQVSSMPAPLYHTLCFRPLQTLLARVQQVPAAEAGVWARQGGFGDLTLKFTACAVRLAKGYMFPPGAAPEEQSAQSAAWNAVVFWSALFHHLPLLAHLEGELLNGECWLPGMTVPDQAYRCRFRQTPPSGAEASAMAALMAGQLLPAEAVCWLAGTPPVLRNLAGALWNGHPEMSLIREVLKQSAEIVAAPSMAAGSLPRPVGNNTPDITPAIAPAISPEPPATDDQPVPALAPDMLLSELASSVPADAIVPAAPPEEIVAAETVAGDGLPAADIPPADNDETDMLLSLFSAVPEVQAEASDVVPPTTAEMSNEGDDTDIAIQITSPTELPAEAADESGPVDVTTEMASATGVLPEVPQAVFPDTPPGADSEGEAIAVSANEPKDIARERPRAESCAGEGAGPEGEAFFDWLKESLRSGQLPANGPQDKVHIVAGHVFLPVPGIFFEYLKQTGKEVAERENIQREFEQLNLCKRRDNKRFWFAHLQQEPQGQGGYKKLKGYLIKGRLIFARMPQYSAFLSFP